MVKALYGMRESSKAFLDVVRGTYFENEWILLQTVPCLACSSKFDALLGWHGDDFYTEGELKALDEVDAMRNVSGKSVSTFGRRNEHGGHDPETHTQVGSRGVHLSKARRKFGRSLRGPTPCSRVIGRRQ